MKEEPTAEKAPNKHAKLKKYLLYGGLALLYLASLYGVYVWQHQQSVDAQKKLDVAGEKLETANKTLESELQRYNDLQEKYEDTQDGEEEASDDATQASTENQETNVVTEPTRTMYDLDVTIHKATTAKYTPYNHHTISMLVTLKNSTKSEIEVKLYDSYQLKDAEGHKFTTTQSGGGYGAEYVPIQQQVLKPGESVKGSFGMTIADYNVLDYTLIWGNHEYAVTATKQPQDWPVN